MLKKVVIGLWLVVTASSLCGCSGSSIQIGSDTNTPADEKQSTPVAQQPQPALRPPPELPVPLYPNAKLLQIDRGDSDQIVKTQVKPKVNSRTIYDFYTGAFRNRGWTLDEMGAGVEVDGRPAPDLQIGENDSIAISASQEKKHVTVSIDNDGADQTLIDFTIDMQPSETTTP